jgi:hypothetical protein
MGYVTKRNEKRRSPTYGVLLAVECNDNRWKLAECEGNQRNAKKADGIQLEIRVRTLESRETPSLCCRYLALEYSDSGLD